jgi:hypothetical protein
VWCNCMRTSAFKDTVPAVCRSPMIFSASLHASSALSRRRPTVSPANRIDRLVETVVSDEMFTSHSLWSLGFYDASNGIMIMFLSSVGFDSTKTASVRCPVP